VGETTGETKPDGEGWGDNRGEIVGVALTLVTSGEEGDWAKLLFCVPVICWARLESTTKGERFIATIVPKKAAEIIAIAPPAIKRDVLSPLRPLSEASQFFE